jgi:hypothetical protein
MILVFHQEDLWNTHSVKRKRSTNVCTSSSNELLVHAGSQGPVDRRRWRIPSRSENQEILETQSVTNHDVSTEDAMVHHDAQKNDEGDCVDNIHIHKQEEESDTIQEQFMDRRGVPGVVQEEVVYIQDQSVDMCGEPVTKSGTIQDRSVDMCGEPVTKSGTIQEQCMDMGGRSDVVQEGHLGIQEESGDIQEQCMDMGGQSVVIQEGHFGIQEEAGGIQQKPASFEVHHQSPSTPQTKSEGADDTVYDSRVYKRRRNRSSRGDNHENKSKYIKKE